MSLAESIRRIYADKKTAGELYLAYGQQAISHTPATSAASLAITSGNAPTAKQFKASSNSQLQAKKVTGWYPEETGGYNPLSEYRNE